MDRLFSPLMNESNSAHLALHDSADGNVEINLSDEFDTVLKAIILDAHEEDHEHLLFDPMFRSKIVEAMIELPVEAELVTERDGHKLRGKKRHLKMIMKRALEKAKAEKGG